jgi:signal transduction histidine kinase
MRLVGLVILFAVSAFTQVTPAPGVIDVILAERDGYAVVSVNDTRIGISPEEQSKIFDRFYRVDRARGRATGGAGLGLAIARWIVECHRGSITVESAANKGSRFSVQMPAASRSSLPSADGQG